MEQEDMVNATLQPVSRIPSSGHSINKKGESKYSEILQSLLGMEPKQPVEISRASVSSKRLYSALLHLLKTKRIKNLRLVARKDKVFAERLF